MSDRDYSLPTIKMLFALSNNNCGMDECRHALADPSWRTVNAEIAHIRGLRPSAPRYVEGYVPVNEFENLILLCPRCHTTIDKTSPDLWSIDRLEEMKSRHELGDKTNWTDEVHLTAYASQAIVSALRQDAGEPNLPVPATLTVNRDGSWLTLVNAGDDAARNVHWTLQGRGASAVFPAEIPPMSIEAGTDFRFASVLENVGDEPGSLTVSWTAADGQQFSETWKLSALKSPGLASPVHGFGTQ